MGSLLTSKQAISTRLACVRMRAMRGGEAERTPGLEGRGHHLAQRFLGLACYLLVWLPYGRRVVGLSRVPRDHRLFVCNHVSLLDTLILGGLFWSRRRLPILVLGDSQVWRGSGLRRFLSSKVGYLIERRSKDRGLMAQLEGFGRSSASFNLIVFPEGTRGDGRHVAPCQPGVWSVARAAGVPIVPVFLAGMERVSTKTTPFRPLAGLRQVRVEFGPEIAPEEYLQLEREPFLERIRHALQALAPEEEPNSRVESTPPVAPTESTRQSAGS